SSAMRSAGWRRCASAAGWASRSRSSAVEQGLTICTRAAPASAARVRGNLRAEQAANNMRDVPVRRACVAGAGASQRWGGSMCHAVAPHH
ncbi:hypothetical protein, partial [Burkholderia territorii]|uniref:hypothetical protein n=1 Tax=Burkholderia territorii TaxID=1503055 RepID=UPI001E53B356